MKPANVYSSQQIDRRGPQTTRVAIASAEQLPRYQRYAGNPCIYDARTAQVVPLHHREMPAEAGACPRHVGQPFGHQSQASGPLHECARVVASGGLDPAPQATLAHT